MRKADAPYAQSVKQRQQLRRRAEGLRALKGEKAYNNPEMDALIEEASTTLDVATRTELYTKIVKLGHEDLPIICLLFPNEIVGARKNIDGIKIYDNCYYPVCTWTLNP